MPENLSEQLLNHTQNGYRVLACATKLIPESNDYETEEDREQFECGLIFLGFVVFRNKLKRDTKHVISKLSGGNINMVMATGDNPFTSISVGRECGLIERDKEIFFCSLEIENNVEVFNLYNLNMGKDDKIGNSNKADNEESINNLKKGIFIIKHRNCLYSVKSEIIK